MWRTVLVTWIACAGGLIVAFWPHPWHVLAPDPDSLMRLVQVRDLIAGQGWFDLVQDRLDPPQGLAMHWSRLIDLPIAALMRLGAAVAGPAGGETLALFAWPLTLLAAFISAAAWAARGLGHDEAAFPAAVLAILCLDALNNFLPGRLDHHNAQLVLVLVAFGAAARAEKSIWAALLSGAVTALMLTIGLETLPYALVLCAAFALRWGLVPQGEGGSPALFGIGLGAALPLLYAASAQHSAPTVCDTISPAYIVPALIGGFGLAALAVAGAAWSRAARLTALVVLGVAALVPVAIYFPQCLAGPYAAVSPELEREWLAGVSEAQTFLAYARAEPVAATGKLAPPVLALGLAVFFTRRAAAEDAFAWFVVLAGVGMALAVGLYQVRATPFANALALPVLGSWVGALRARPGRGLGHGVALVAVWLAAMPVGYYGLGWLGVRLAGRAMPEAVAVTPAVRTSEPARECADEASARALAAVPPGLVLAPVFFGPTILALSPHSVVSGPYHRGGAAIIDAVRALDGNPAEARAIVERRKVAYLAFCASARETRLTAREAPGGLLGRLLAGESFGWLAPVAQAGTTSLRLYRVVPAP